MKRTTRNNILRYTIATVFVSAFLVIASLLCIGLALLTDKTGLPIYTIVLVAGFIFTIYFVGKGITIQDKNKE